MRSLPSPASQHKPSWKIPRSPAALLGIMWHQIALHVAIYLTVLRPRGVEVLRSRSLGRSLTHVTGTCMTNRALGAYPETIAATRSSVRV